MLEKENYRLGRDVDIQASIAAKGETLQRGFTYGIAAALLVMVFANLAIASPLGSISPQIPVAVASGRSLRDSSRNKGTKYPSGTAYGALGFAYRGGEPSKVS